MWDANLTKAHKQLLCDQAIDAERPGPVLHDFRVVLDFVGTDGVKTPGEHNLLPMNAIGELNQRLSRPLLLAEMKRPQLRSHPYLQGLHLLLRASGLGRVEGSGAKGRLVLDPALIEQWERLNPTEQFFTLLEAWLLRGRPEMIGERGSSWETLLRECLTAWNTIAAKGPNLKLDQPFHFFVPAISFHLYHLALMDLFGIMEVKHRPHAVQPWQPADVGLRPFGDAVFAVLNQSAQAIPLHRRFRQEDWDEQGRPRVPTFRTWQPVFQPYFPEWRNNLTLPTTVPRKGVLVFRVSLGPVWRRIAMPAKATLDDLVHWILRSVKFSSDHLYAFTYRDRFGAPFQANHPYMEEGTSADQVHIGELPLEPGQSMELEYDFGDSWPFTVQLESIEPAGAKIKAPAILEKHGKSPEQYPRWEE